MSKFLQRQVSRELLKQGNYSVTAESAIELLDDLDEANAIIRALVDPQVWARHQYSDGLAICGKCLHGADTPAEITHAPDCPVGRGLEQVRKAAE